MSSFPEPEYDVIFVGAGFGAITTLHRLIITSFRKLGLRCKIFEAGARSGGVWYWNCYPGARVDSDAPLYQLFDKEMWDDFSFTERYPARNELCRYFDHIDSKINFSKDVEYNKRVRSARYDEERNIWTVKCEDGTKATGRWFVPAIGFAAKPLKPRLKGSERFRGELHHTAEWPQDDIDLKGKRIAVIGTGASGIQVIQECSKDSKQLTVYQRTPNLCLPMSQEPLPFEVDSKRKLDGFYDSAFKATFTTKCGFNFDFVDRKLTDDTPEERQAFFNELMYGKGGFRFWLATYSDVYEDEKSNYEVYKFWRDTVRQRIKDPRKRELLAPMEPPHPFGTKRPSLEQHYYECFDDEHVDIVDVSQDPIEEVTETGIRTKSGDTREFDVIVLATGFDAVTGSLAQMDIRNAAGESISDHWKEGLKTTIGIALHGFPNMFFLYGPGAPTAFSNGPSTVQIQAIFLDRLMKLAKEHDIVRVEATKEAEEAWSEKTREAWYSSLFPQAKSWYQGSNVPGKKVEPLNYVGGIPKYIKALDDSLDNDFQGWRTAQAVS